MKRTSKVKKMSRQTYPTKKALKERRFRQREADRKQFEKPLRKFIEYKYTNIYEEYTQLYEAMVRNHPGVRNLTETRTFKDAVCQATPSDILSTVIRETFGQNMIEQDEVVNTPAEVNDQIQQDQTASDKDDDDEPRSPEETSEQIDDQIQQDQVASDRDEIVRNEVSEAESTLIALQNEADSIIEEMIQNEFIRDILELEPEDEGIEVNTFDDIMFDAVEDFDYELEVEQYDEGYDWLINNKGFDW